MAASELRKHALRALLAIVAGVGTLLALSAVNDAPVPGVLIVVAIVVPLSWIAVDLIGYWRRGGRPRRDPWQRHYPPARYR